MEKIISQLSLLNKEYEYNNIKSVESYLNLPILNILKEDIYILEDSNIESNKEKLLTIFMTKISKLFFEDTLKYNIEKYELEDSADIIKSFDINYLKNFNSRFERLNKLFELLNNKLKEEKINTLKFEENFNDIMKDLNTVYSISNSYLNINNKTTDFINLYKNLDYNNETFNEYKSYIGEDFKLISEENKLYKIIAGFQNDEDISNKEKLLDLIYKMENELSIKSPLKYERQSDYYVNNKNNKNIISDFLIKANIESNLVVNCNFEKPHKIERFILFKDNTGVIEYCNGSIKQISYLEKDHLAMKIEIEKEIINQTFIKKPNIAKFFIEKLNEGESFQECTICMQTFIENESILKNSKINILSFADKSLENIYDYICEHKKKYKIEQMCKHVFSNKYKHLINEDTFEMIGELFDKGVNASKLQDFVGSKLAMFKDDKEINKYIANILDQLSSFNIESLTQKLDLLGIKPIIEDNNRIIIEIETFNQSKALGSQSWCISREEYYFDDYKSGNSKQYFLFDFNKDELDLNSMIGFTLYDNGEFRSQHLKNDDYLDVNEDLKNLRMKILEKNIDKFKLSTSVNEEYSKFVENKKLTKIKNLL